MHTKKESILNSSEMVEKKKEEKKDCDINIPFNHSTKYINNYIHKHAIQPFN